jgi:divalent metal cation (Fe/Co/Zn/Cd) transporter
LLADRAPDPTIESEIRRIAGSVNGVLGLDKCYVRKMGLSFYADLHVVVRGTLSVREGHTIAHKVENAVLENMSQVEEVLVHVKPDHAGQLAPYPERDGTRVGGLSHISTLP